MCSVSGGGEHALGLGVRAGDDHVEPGQVEPLEGDRPEVGERLVLPPGHRHPLQEGGADVSAGELREKLGDEHRGVERGVREGLVHGDEHAFRAGKVSEPVVDERHFQGSPLPNPSGTESANPGKPFPKGAPVFAPAAGPQTGFAMIAGGVWGSQRVARSRDGASTLG